MERRRHASRASCTALVVFKRSPSLRYATTKAAAAISLFDPYLLLGLPPETVAQLCACVEAPAAWEARAAWLRDAYHELAALYHPDAARPRTAAPAADAGPRRAAMGWMSEDAAFSCVTAAYTVLSDPRSALEYLVAAGALGGASPVVVRMLVRTLRRNAAADTVRNMAHSIDAALLTQAKRQHERGDGLLVLRALYGNLRSISQRLQAAAAKSHAGEGVADTADAAADVIDVTRVLRGHTEVVEAAGGATIVQLVLPPGSKRGIEGFWDPCDGYPSHLYLRYGFLGRVHEITIADDAPLRCPLKKHQTPAAVPPESVHFLQSLLATGTAAATGAPPARASPTRAPAASTGSLPATVSSRRRRLPATPHTAGAGGARVSSITAARGLAAAAALCASSEEGENSENTPPSVARGGAARAAAGEKAGRLQAHHPALASSSSSMAQRRSFGAEVSPSIRNAGSPTASIPISSAAARSGGASPEPPSGAAAVGNIKPAAAHLRSVASPLHSDSGSSTSAGSWSSGASPSPSPARCPTGPAGSIPAGPSPPREEAPPQQGSDAKRRLAVMTAPIIEGDSDEQRTGGEEEGAGQLGAGAGARGRSLGAPSAAAASSASLDAAPDGVAPISVRDASSAGVVTYTRCVDAAGRVVLVRTLGDKRKAQMQLKRQQQKQQLQPQQQSRRLLPRRTAGVASAAAAMMAAREAASSATQAAAPTASGGSQGADGDAVALAAARCLEAELRAALLSVRSSGGGAARGSSSAPLSQPAGHYAGGALYALGEEDDGKEGGATLASEGGRGAGRPTARMPSAASPAPAGAAAAGSMGARQASWLGAGLLFVVGAGIIAVALLLQVQRRATASPSAGRRGR